MSDREKLDDAKQEIQRLRAALVALNHKIEQILGTALGYPRYCDDSKNFPGATEADGVCVGDHVAETLAEEAAERITEAERQRDQWKFLYEEFGYTWRCDRVRLDTAREALSEIVALKTIRAAREMAKEVLIAITNDGEEQGK